MNTKIYQLNQLSAISLTGDNTQTFLQGQLTCDVNALKAAGDYSFGACCDHKGRMVANFWIVRRHNDFLIILPADMRDIVIEHLQKYAMFSKVTLKPEDDIALGAADDVDTEALKKHFDHEASIITLPNTKRHIILNTTSIDAANNTNWLHQNIQDKLALLSPATSLLFTPQMISLEKLGGVSFTKGCYVGQEIVARTQHLGKLKRHLHHVHVENDKPMMPGDSLMNKNKEKVGIIVNATFKDSVVDALAVVEDRLIDSIQKALV